MLNNYKKDCIGIICGKGLYPKLMVMKCLEKNLDFYLVFINGTSSYEKFIEMHVDGFSIFNFNNLKFISVNLGEVGAIIEFFHKFHVNKVVFSGAVQRPNFKQLKLDRKGSLWLLKLGKKIFCGDDELLKALAILMEKEGFEVIAGTDFIEDIFVSSINLTNVSPTESEWYDIKIGIQAARTLGSIDVGQSVIVHDGLVLGVECVEGTDELIKRCAILRKSSRGGTLVKMSKPQQDIRIDLPTIGAETIDLLGVNNFSGVAVEAKRCIVLDQQSILKRANEFSIFVCGVEP